jgi:hypothetical protein
MTPVRRLKGTELDVFKKSHTKDGKEIEIVVY